MVVLLHSAPPHIHNKEEEGAPLTSWLGWEAAAAPWVRQRVRMETAEDGESPLPPSAASRTELRPAAAEGGREGGRMLRRASPSALPNIPSIPAELEESLWQENLQLEVLFPPHLERADVRSGMWREFCLLKKNKICKKKNKSKDSEYLFYLCSGPKGPLCFTLEKGSILTPT